MTEERSWSGREERRLKLIEEGRFVTVVSLNTLWDAHQREARQRLGGELLAENGCDVALLQEIPTEDLVSSLERIENSSGLRVVSVGKSSGTCSTAILSRLDGDDELPITHTVGETVYLNAVARVRIGDTQVRFCSAHLPWGGRAENLRLEAAMTISEALDERGGVAGCVLGGDFNALEESASIRYLTGVQPVGERTAQWTDSWRVAGVGCGHTSSPENPLATRVGMNHGFMEPYLLPDRRIDYVFVQGYANGGYLTPLEVKVVRRARGAAFYPSDHWAVMAKLLI